MLRMWLKRLALAAALAVMPLQGVASTLSVLLCHGDAQAHAAHAHAAHAADSHERGAHSDGQPDEGGAPGLATCHLCCHYTVTAPAIVTLRAALPDFQVRALAPDFPHGLYIPEQPQRPPLA